MGNNSLNQIVINIRLLLSIRVKIRMNYYIEVFRNINGLFTSAFTAYALYEFNFNHNSSLLESNSWVVLINLLVDSTMITSPVVMFHHAISLGYCVVFYTHSIDMDMMQNTVAVLFSCEISTIFLCVRQLFILHPNIKLQNEIVYFVNDVLFVWTFFYFRIYLFPYYILFDPAFFYSYPTSECAFYVLSYSLIGLNIYWSILIGCGIFELLFKIL